MIGRGHSRSTENLRSFESGNDLAFTTLFEEMTQLRFSQYLSHVYNFETASLAGLEWSSNEAYPGLVASHSFEDDGWCLIATDTCTQDSAKLSIQSPRAACRLFESLFPISRCALACEPIQRSLRQGTYEASQDFSMNLSSEALVGASWSFGSREMTGQMFWSLF